MRRFFSNPGVVLALSAVLLHLPALLNPFVWDDEFHVQRALSRPFDLGEVFLPGIRFRPLLFLPGSIDALVWGANAFGWHLTNLVLHAAVVALSYLAVKRLADPRTAALTAAVVAFHPAASEVASWVMARGDSLSALFGLGALLAAGGRRTALTAALLLGSLLAKETGAAWLVLVPLAHGRAALLPAGIAVAAYAPMRILLMGAGGGPSFLLRGMEGADFVRTALGAAGWYVREAFLPLWYAGYVGESPLDPVHVIVGALALAFAGAGIAYTARHKSLSALALVWSVLPVLPSIVTAAAPVSSDAVASRHLYAALPGLGLLLALAVPSRVGRAPVVLLFAVLAGLAASRDRVWRSNEALWSTAAVHDADSRYVLANLGLARILERGDVSGAEDAFARAAVSPERGTFMRVEVAAQLAMLRAARGDVGGARAALDAVEGIRPDASGIAEQRYARALVSLMSLGDDPAPAVEALRASLALENESRASSLKSFFLASVLERRGDHADAVAVFDTSVRTAGSYSGIRRLASLGREHAQVRIAGDPLQEARALQRAGACERAVSLLVSLPDVRAAVIEAQCAIAARNHARAAAAFARAERLAPGVPELCRARIEQLRAAGEPVPDGC